MYLHLTICSCLVNDIFVPRTPIFRENLVRGVTMLVFACEASGTDHGREMGHHGETSAAERTKKPREGRQI